jgi:hypothetical protein
MCSDETTLHSGHTPLFCSCLVPGAGTSAAAWCVAPAQPPLARCGLGAGDVAAAALSCLFAVWRKHEIFRPGQSAAMQVGSCGWTMDGRA